MDFSAQLELVGFEDPEMPTEIDQCGSFVGKFEFDAFDLARIFAAAFAIGVDGNFVQSGGLVARQRRKIEVRVAAGLRAHIIGHVGKAEFGELGDDSIGGNLGALRLRLGPPLRSVSAAVVF